MKVVQLAFIQQLEPLAAIDTSICSLHCFWTLNGKFMMIYVEVTTFQHFDILPIDQIQQVFLDGI